MNDLDRDSDVLGADRLMGHGNFNTDGNLHLAGSLGNKPQKTFNGDLNDSLDDLPHRDGNTVPNNLPNGARNFNAFNSIYAVGALESFWTGLGIQISTTRWA